MSLARSTYYSVSAVSASDAGIVTDMRGICDEFETYGYRRLGASLRQQGTARKCGGSCTSTICNHGAGGALR